MFNLLYRHFFTISLIEAIFSTFSKYHVNYLKKYEKQATKI